MFSSKSGLQIHEDAVVSVKTRGLIGEKYMQISAGAADDIITPGGRVLQTETAGSMDKVN